MDDSNEGVRVPMPTEDNTFMILDDGPFAQLSIASDGSFVETSSGLAARELKRRYDQHIGVNAEKTSPFAITAFTNQHGKQTFRVGRKELVKPPALSAQQIEEQQAVQNGSGSGSGNTRPPGKRRQSRLSSVLMNSNGLFTGSTKSVTTQGSTSRGKLRKTRSIPDLNDTPVVGQRGHSHSVTSMDMPAFMLSQESMMPSILPMPSLHAWQYLPIPGSSSSGSETGSSVSNSTSSSVADLSQSVLQYSNPFGPGITFDHPMQFAPPSHHHDEEDDTHHHLGLPRQLRLMQSFESGLTARQDPPSTSNEDAEPEDEDRPPSAMRVRPRASLASLVQIANEASETLAHPSPPASPALPEELVSAPPPKSPVSSPLDLQITTLQSRYTTEIFDVLQTYRGLPTLENLVSGESVIKLSLNKELENTAAPRDDPRFVIWGEVSTGRQDISRSNSSVSAASSRRSNLHQSSPPPATNRTSHAPPQISNSDSGEDSKKRIMVAATIERWIAQLTSEMSYDELLNFFITYRTYVSAVDLCHLLICRFHWSLQKPSSLEEPAIWKKISAFVGLFWLLTFFAVDFVPNLELRRLISGWLNTLVKDPILKDGSGGSEGLNTVKKLKKVVKDCKRAHVRVVDPKASPPRSRSSTTASSTSPPQSRTAQLFGERFAEATRQLHPQDDQDEDSDLDLEFDADELEVGSGSGAGHHANATLAKAHTSIIAPMAKLEPITAVTTSTPFVQTSATLPIHMPGSGGLMSKVLVKTMGRLGRWKRVVNPSSPSPLKQSTTPGLLITSSTPPVLPKASTSSRMAAVRGCTDMSAFDIDPMELTRDEDSHRDMLQVNGGVERYLTFMDQALAKPVTTPSSSATLAAPPSASSTTRPTSSATTPGPSEKEKNGELPPPPLPEKDHVPVAPQVTAESVTTTPLTVSDEPDAKSLDSNGRTDAHTNGVDEEDLDPSTPSVEDSPSLPPGLSHASRSSAASEFSSSSGHAQIPSNGSSSSTPPQSASPLRTPVSTFGRAASIRTISSVSSFGEPISGGGQFGASFRNGESSNTPWRFDVVSIDELDLSDDDGPSLPPGLTKTNKKLPLRREFEFEFVPRPESSVASMRHSTASSARNSVSSNSSSSSLPSVIWGNRPIEQWAMNSLLDNIEPHELEGQMSNTRQVEAEHDKRVVGWLRLIKDRLDREDYEDEHPRWWTQEDEEEAIREREEAEAGSSEEEVDDIESKAAVSETRAEDGSDATAPERINQGDSSLAKPAPEDAVPAEILQSRVSTQPTQQLVQGDSASPQRQPDPQRMSISRFVNPAEEARFHRSFVLITPLDQLAEHFAMIDRELFMGVKFEELISSSDSTDPLGGDFGGYQVLDWAQFLKDRAQWKNDGMYHERTSALAAVKARFSLISGFVASEIVLTRPEERMRLINKFIRTCFRDSRMPFQNYNTTVAIVWGLRNDFVLRILEANPSRFRIGQTEAKMMHALDRFTSRSQEYLYLRNAIQSVAEQAVPVLDAHATKTKIVIDRSACVPFIGVYLEQLKSYSMLPDLVDPTDPTRPVGIDPET
ncbi:hypothetical protein DL96DRAFT_1586895, partial [Flagelloscypha sp. PMI_526]